jgi:hypothetical protein
MHTVSLLLLTAFSHNKGKAGDPRIDKLHPKQETVRLIAEVLPPAGGLFLSIYKVKCCSILRIDKPEGLHALVAQHC